MREIAKVDREVIGMCIFAAGALLVVSILALTIVSVSWIRHHADTPCSDIFCPCQEGGER